MFIKPYAKYNTSTKERHLVFKLCESYRINQSIRHHIIINLGRLEELESVEEKKMLGARIEELIKGGGNTLALGIADEKIEQLAQGFYKDILSRRRYDVRSEKEDWETVNMKTLKNKDARDMGAEWLCKQAFDQLKISDFLKAQGWDDNKVSLAATHIICRAVYPVSELMTVSCMKENSAISELTGSDTDKITKDLLYGIAHRLYAVKPQLEQYLSRRTSELFDLEDKIILYDLTNTYYEGRMHRSKTARFGRSKEKRNDAKIVVLALVINREGFLKYSNIFEGNTADCNTLEAVISTLSRETSGTARKPIVVIDAGIATEENLAMLRSRGYDYLCVSRSGIKDFCADTGGVPVVIKTKNQQPIQVLKMRTPQGDDHYLCVRSPAKALKEESMNTLLSQRFEQGMQNINEGVLIKGGTKKLTRVYERIGRLKQKYPSIHKYYDIQVSDNGQGIASRVSCERKPPEDINPQAGVYFLRTTLNGQDEKTLWDIYNAIREIEYTFRVLKTDLDLRPIYHKTDAASMAHLHLGVLAYWLVSTIRYQLKQKGIHYNWREIVRIMSTQKCVTTSVENIREEVITVRQCTEPSTKVRQIYDLLGYKHFPFTRKKSVVPPAEIFKKDNPKDQIIADG